MFGNSRKPQDAATSDKVLSRLSGHDNEFFQSLSALWNSGHQCGLLTTRENGRVQQIAETFVREKSAGKPASDRVSLVQWDALDGFRFYTDDRTTFKVHTIPVQEQNTQLGFSVTTVNDPHWMLRAIPSLDKFKNFITPRTLVIVNDIYPFINNNITLRSLLKRMHAEESFVTRGISRFVLFIQSSTAWHPEVEHCIKRLYLPLPNDEEMEYAVTRLELENFGPVTTDKSNIRVTGDVRKQVIESLRGLSLREAEDVVSLSYVLRGSTPRETRDQATLEVIERHKAEAVSTGTGLTYIPKSQICKAEDVCGYEAFLDAVKQRAQAYEEDAQVAKLDLPRGWVLVGVPGTGKSQMGMAVAHVLKKPLWIWDPSMCMGSLVGQSETQVADALNKIESQRGCVVLIDEIDKLWGNATKQAGDGGVSARIFGKILRWMQERKDGAVVIMTLNDSSLISPEMFRSGRVDGVYGVCRPDAEVRRQILRVHFARRNVDKEHLELTIDTAEKWQQFDEASAGLLGSDIEEVVKTSRDSAYARLRRAEKPIGTVLVPTFTEILDALEVVTRQSIATMEKERIETSERNIRERCRPVNYPAVSQGRTRSGRALTRD